MMQRIDFARNFKFRAYEMACHELDPQLLIVLREWSQADAESVLRERASCQKTRRKLCVHYCRIGHSLSFPLPLAAKPKPAELPAGIAGLTYPWLTWVAWLLEERWRALHAAWRRWDDSKSGNLLQREMSALKNWRNFLGENDRANLITGHVAACFSLALQKKSGWRQDFFPISTRPRMPSWIAI